MKVILINPPVETGKYSSSRTCLPPLGIAYLAATLERNDVECEIIDGKLEGLTVQEIGDRVIAAKPNLVGLSAMTPDIVAAGKIAAHVKRGLPDMPVVAGGAHVIAIPRQTLEEFPQIDYVVTGEGEQTVLELIESLNRGRDRRTIAGLGFRENGDICINPIRPYIQDLDSVPFPKWEKFRGMGHEFPVLSSRGCPFHCSFCMRAMGQSVRNRSPLSVVEEIQWLVDSHQARRIVFHDETFTLKKERIAEITDLLIQKGLHRRIRWVAQTRVDRADFDVFVRMKAAGCEQVELGVESGNQEILNTVEKGIRLEQVEQTVRLAKKAGLKTACTFILGHPNETEQTIWQTIHFAARLKPTAVSLGIMSPYPGTKIWEMAQKGEGNYRLLSRKWEDFLRFGQGCLELENLSRRRLEWLQFRGYVSFYMRTHKFVGLIRYGWPRRKQTWTVLRKLLSSRRH